MAVKSSDESREALRGVQEALREAEDRLEELNATLSQATKPDETLTVRELAEQFNVSEASVRAFAQTVGELLEGEELSPAEARRAAMVAAAGVVWERALGPLLSAGQVRELLGVSRQRVDELLRAKRLIGLRERSGRRRYPLFSSTTGGRSGRWWRRSTPSPRGWTSGRPRRGAPIRTLRSRASRRRNGPGADGIRSAWR
jgi:hypothetical protein